MEFAETCLSWQGGNWGPRPGRPAPLWGRLEQILTEGLSRREGSGRKVLRPQPQGHPPPRAEGNESGVRGKHAVAEREAGWQEGSLSTDRSDGLCVEPVGHALGSTEEEAPAAASLPRCLGRSVCAGCPGPSFQEGCAPPEPPVSPQASALEGSPYLSELRAWPSLTVPRLPGGKRKNPKQSKHRY